MMARKKKFIAALSLVAVHFGVKMTSELAQSYEFALQDEDEAGLIAACHRLIKGQYFPRAHDFIQETGGHRIDPKDLANLRWSEIKAWLWDKGEFPPDLIAKGIFEQMGDKFMFRAMTDAELKGAGFEFRRSYVAKFEIEENSDRIGEIESADVGLAIGSVAGRLTMGD